MKMTRDELISMATAMLGDKDEAIKLVNARKRIEDVLFDLISGHKKSHDDGTHDHATCQLTSDVALKKLYPFVAPFDIEVAQHCIFTHTIVANLRKLNAQLPDILMAHVIEGVEDGVRALLWVLETMNNAPVEKTDA